MISGEKYVMTLFDVLSFANQGKVIVAESIALNYYL